MTTPPGTLPRRRADDSSALVYTTSALSWAAGLLCAVLGTLMIVAPHQFESSSYPALRTNTLAWGVAFLIAGAAVLAAAALAPAGSLNAVAHLFASAVLLLIAQGFAASGVVTNAIAFGALGLGTAAAPFLPRARDRGRHAPDLLGLTIGVTAALIGLTFLVLPGQLWLPAFDPIRAYLATFGLAFLGTGVGLLYVQFRSAGPTPGWIAHLVVAALYCTFAALVALPSRSMTGVLYFGGFGVAVALVPWLGPRLARIDPTSLRTRLALALITATTLPLLIAVAVGNDQAERARVAEALGEQGVLAASLGRDVATYVSTYRSTMSAVASRLDPTMPAEQQRAALKTLTATDVLAFSTFDADGRNVARSDDLPLAPLAPRLAEEIRRTGAASQLVGPSPRFGPTLLTFAAPSRGAAGEVRGFVAAEIDATRLAVALARSHPTTSPGEPAVFVVGADGRVVSHPDAALIAAGADFSHRPAVAAVLSGSQGGALRYPTAAGDQLGGYAVVPGVGWIVVGERPVAGVVAATRALRDISFGFLLLVTAIAAAAGVMAADRLVRPLQALSRAVDRLAAGDASAPLPRSEIGEVANLTTVFGEMRDRLAARTAERERATADLGESEARKDAILRTALDSIFTLDQDGRVVDFNPAAEKAFGFSLSEAVGRELADLIIPPSQREDVRRAWARFSAVGETPSAGQTTDLTLMRRDGSELPGEVAASPIKVGGADLFTLFVRDVTDRKQAEAERAHRQAQEEIVRAKDELVSIVSHELRTPLVSLVGFAELMLARDFSEAERREFLAIILSEGQRLTALINDFLDLERMESGRLAIVPEPADLGTIVARAVAAAGDDTLRPIVLDLPADLPPVAADDDRVLQVLANLLSNARKYSPSGGEVRLSARAIESSVEVSVTDQGLGVPGDALPQLFEKFYRVDNSDRREIGGTGLGLAICRQIISAHGGRIWGESAGQGLGSTFRFTLPVVTGLPASGDVLVVEDDSGFARLLEAELAALGLSTARVTSAEAALARLDQAPARAVVLDLLLPGLQGEAFLTHLSGNGRPTVPVIVVTVKELSVVERSELERLGVRAVFQKGPGIASQAARAVGGTLQATIGARETGDHENEETIQ